MDIEGKVVTHPHFAQGLSLYEEITEGPGDNAEGKSGDPVTGEMPLDQAAESRADHDDPHIIQDRTHRRGGKDLEGLQNPLADPGHGHQYRLQKHDAGQHHGKFQRFGVKAADIEPDELRSEDIGDNHQQQKQSGDHVNDNAGESPDFLFFPFGQIRRDHGNKSGA